MQDKECLQKKIALDALERYSGSPATDFCSYLLITNFPKYVKIFAEKYDVPIYEGSAFKTAHCPSLDISIIDFKFGSPAAALLVDCIVHKPIKAALHLGMCGGLREEFNIGDYMVPVASIRDEGTSNFYFSQHVPAMANFLMQRSVSNILEASNINFHIGICYTTNKRFWEFNEGFKKRLAETRAQGIEMESATLFSASYYYRLPMGALYLISDLPFKSSGIKDKKISDSVFKNYAADHVDHGIDILQDVKETLLQKPKKVFRGESMEEKMHNF